MLRNYLAAQSAARGKSIYSSPKRSRSLNAIRSTAFHSLSSHRSFIEPLESRHLLSATVIEVNTTVDGFLDSNPSLTSLREAILMANASLEDNVIVVPAGTYVLEIPGANEDAGISGDLDITGNGSLRIVGAGSDQTTITAIGLINVNTLQGDRILDVLPGANVEITGVTLTGGAPPTSTGDLANRSGGAIRVSGANLTLTDSNVFDNTSSRGGGVSVDATGVARIDNVTFRGNESPDGGAIFNAGTLEVDGAVISGNEAVNRGGGITNTGELLLQNSTLELNFAAGNGGGIANTGNAGVVGSSFSRNTTFRNGGAIYSTGTMTVTGVQMTNNSARGRGGAIWNQGTMSLDHWEATLNASLFTDGGAVANEGDMEIRNSILTYNQAPIGGGAIYNHDNADLLVEHTRIESNVSEYGDGGGIRSRNGTTLSIFGSEILNNMAGTTGGGIVASGTLKVTASTIAGNRSQTGAGIYAGGTTEIVASTISGNITTSSGGGLALGGTATLLNSTVSGNQSGDKGGGIHNAGQLLISHSTLTGNRATGANGGGVYLAGNNPGAKLTLDQAIVAGNFSGTPESPSLSDIVRQIATLPVSGRFSIVGDPSTAPGLTNGVNGNIVGNGYGGVLDINLVLETTLADNGGPTLTHALMHTGPAVNNGDPAFDPNAFDPALQFDQRGEGYPRVVGGRIDMGAYETETDPLPVDGVITVTTFDDIVAIDGLWSLREAVLWANAHSEDNEIVLAAGTYNLTRQGTHEDAGLTGDLDVTANGSLKIVGAGRDNTTIDAAGLYNAELGYGDRIFDVLAGSEVEIEALTLTGGNLADDSLLFPADGGAIRNAGVLSFSNAAATENTALGGGAISNSANAQLVVSGSTLSHNAALENGGAISNPFSGIITISDSELVSNQAAGRGGAIYSFGDGTVSDSTISENTANYEGGGLFVRGEFELVDTNVTGNEAGLFGGGILAWSYAGLGISGGSINSNTAENGGGIYKRNGVLTITGAELNDNTATNSGGAMSLFGDDFATTVTGSTLSGNSAGTGGAIYHEANFSPVAPTAATLVVQMSEFTQNQAANGGAITNAGIVRIEESVFRGNEASRWGGAIYSVGLGTLSDSQVTDNVAENGGGIFSQFEPRLPEGYAFTILRSNVSGNTATGDYQNAGGGGIVNIGRMLVQDSTINDNSTLTQGGGIHNYTSLNNGLLHVVGSAFSGNSAGFGGAIHSFHAAAIVVDSTFTENSAAYGGALAREGSGALIEVYSSSFEHNSATEDGGAIYGSFWVSNSYFAENTAKNGGAIGGFVGQILASTFTQNSATMAGGAVHAISSGPLTIVNSTVSNNSAHTGGGIAVPTGSQLELLSTTVVLNRADGADAIGGGIAVLDQSTATITNSIVAGNVAGVSGDETPSDIALVGGSLDPASGYNLVGDPSSAGGLVNGVNGNIVGDGLGGILDVGTVIDTTLADNGGPTPTHALLSSGPAVNAGDPAFAPNSTNPPTLFDQRGAGFARITGGRVDIGAFEFGSEYEPLVVGRHVFYNNSNYDFLFDRDAIDPTKQALLPNGSLAEPSNVTSYSRGVNGIMIDLAGSHPDITADDFIFRVGATNDPESWALAPSPSAIQVLAGQGVGGADRIVITWPDGAIKNTYLQVIVVANADTGLGEEDVFFFGNRVGDAFSTQPPTSFVTSAADELVARNAMPKSNLDVANPFDFDKSRTISAADMLIARNNPGALPRIQIVPPVAPSPLVSVASPVFADTTSPAAIAFAAEDDATRNALISGLASGAKVAEATAALASATVSTTPSPTATAKAIDAVISAAWSSVEETEHASEGAFSSLGDELDDLIGELLPSLS